MERLPNQMNEAKLTTLGLSFEDFRMIDDVKLAFAPVRTAAAATYEGDVGTIWSLQSDGMLTREASPLDDLQQAVQDHLSNGQDIAKELQEQAEDISDMQVALDTVTGFRSLATEERMDVKQFLSTLKNTHPQSQIATNFINAYGSPSRRSGEPTARYADDWARLWLEFGGARSTLPSGINYAPTRYGTRKAAENEPSSGINQSMENTDSNPASKTVYQSMEEKSIAKAKAVPKVAPAELAQRAFDALKKNRKGTYAMLNLYRDAIVVTDKKMVPYMQQQGIYTRDDARALGDALKALGVGTISGRVYQDFWFDHQD